MYLVLYLGFLQTNTVLLKILSTMIFASIAVVTKMASMRSGPAILANTITKDQLLVVLAAIKNKWANGVANVITLTRTKMTFVLIVQGTKKEHGPVHCVTLSTASILSLISFRLNAIDVETLYLVDGIASQTHVQNGMNQVTTRGVNAARIAKQKYIMEES